MKIRGKLILSFTALVAFLAISLGIVSSITASDVLETQAELNLSYKAIEGAKLIESEMETQRLALQVLAARKDFPEDLLEELKKRFVDFSNYEGIETKVQGFIESSDTMYDVIRNLDQ